jgi:hypothetical protein
MESDRLDPRQARRIAERAEAAPYVNYPPTPQWYPPVVGLWSAALALVLTLGLTGDRGTQPWVLLLVALELLFLRWLTRRHGAMPSFRHPPAEFRGVLGRYVAGVVVVVMAVVVTATFGGAVPAAVVTFLVVTPAVALHERSFAAAADRVRARLA